MLGRGTDLLDELVKNYGLQVTGVELSKQELNYAKKKMGLNVINAPLRDLR